jgi:DNA helicase HerA-like ATPase
MPQAMPIARVSETKQDLVLLPGLTNRHGLVAGATGTGKTVTLQVMAEALSRNGVPIFAADVKGDLSGISQPGQMSPKFQQRLQTLGLPTPAFGGCPVTLWDVFGEQGHPVRATVSEMGPLLLSRILNLNDTQAGVLTLVFKIADDEGLLLLDLKDLRAMLQHAGDNAAQYKTQYGNISAASIGAIQRGLVALEQQGGDKFFGEPALNLDDLLQTDQNGHGVINLLAADRLMQAPQLYATFLLWLLSELFETLPEVGDPEKPKLVFFFDEAHLLFNDLPATLGTRIEQVIRLIRSKGVGVYFVTQNPTDISQVVLSQLGNRVQHALRAFTPNDQKAVRSAADTFRTNPKLDTGTVITQLAVGEALVSFLDETGTPGIVERATVYPPASQIGPITAAQRQQLMANSPVTGVYEKAMDRESAYERLTQKAQQSPTPAQMQQRDTVHQQAQTSVQQGAPASGGGFAGGAGGLLNQAMGALFTSGNSRRMSPGQAMVNSAARAIGSQVGRDLIRGALGTLLGGSRRR